VELLLGGAMKIRRVLHLGFERLRLRPEQGPRRGGERLRLKLKPRRVIPRHGNERPKLAKHRARHGDEKLHEEPIALDIIADIDMHQVGMWVTSQRYLSNTTKTVVTRYGFGRRG